MYWGYNSYPKKDGQFLTSQIQPSEEGGDSWCNEDCKCWKGMRHRAVGLHTNKDKPLLDEVGKVLGESDNPTEIEKWNHSFK